MMTHCFLYVWGIRPVTAEIFHTSLSSGRTLPNTGVVVLKLFPLGYIWRHRSLALLYFFFLVTVKFTQTQFALHFQQEDDCKSRASYFQSGLFKTCSPRSTWSSKNEKKGLTKFKFPVYVEQTGLQKEAGSRLNLNCCHTGAIVLFYIVYYFSSQIHSHNVFEIT